MSAETVLTALADEITDTVATIAGEFLEAEQDDLAEFANEIQVGLIMAMMNGREDLVEVFKGNLEMLAETARVRLVHGTWDAFFAITTKVLGTIVKAAIAV